MQYVNMYYLNEVEYWRALPYKIQALLRHPPPSYFFLDCLGISGERMNRRDGVGPLVAIIIAEEEEEEVAATDDSRGSNNGRLISPLTTHSALSLPHSLLSSPPPHIPTSHNILD